MPDVFPCLDTDHEPNTRDVETRGKLTKNTSRQAVVKFSQIEQYFKCLDYCRYPNTKVHLVFVL